MQGESLSTSERATLYPQTNPLRQSVDLSGFWDFRIDPEDVGREREWSGGFTGYRPVAVPSSWNDQFSGLRDYLGPAWYQTCFNLPWTWEDRRVRLRFGSVNYLAEVWLNGTPLGHHEGGHLPFEFDVTSHVRPENNLLIVRVEGELAPDRVPPGNIPPDPRDVPHQNFPDTSFDFFPFCGIQRPVLLYATPYDAIVDLTVTTDIEDRDGSVRVLVDRTAAEAATARFVLRGHGAEVVEEVEASDETVQAELKVVNAALWAPGSPNLYNLTVELVQDGTVFDRYSLPVGIRTVSIEGDTLLLNGQPVELKGFGRHEDFPVTGRGYVPAVMNKDYALMEWVGANSFRTSHYPYSEEDMDLADHLGFLVIDETPAVGLFFKKDGVERRLALCKQMLKELIDRDKNHPSVILWSLANEPMSTRPGSGSFFRELYDLTKSKDPIRPVTVVSRPDVKEESFEFCDVICINRYYGWYSEIGRLDEGCAVLSRELDELHERYHKPLILTEFGADAVPGFHAEPPEMFSEEYQAEMLSRYIEVLESKPYIVGQHVWNLCDFKTAQGVWRVGGINFKGVFTRDRRPKMGAHRLRELWSE
ncbi:MAG: beta-glucuronidase [Rubrobacteraceae bacterium]|nr:beta-glucuronidase [Rubrobacteraceae bacterium]MCL6438831.1 beta-glucuronidase [Rubrobacteraceae bacterium]